MFLSIVIPVYNSADYLEQCLDACMRQTFPKDNYEVICVNDGSVDDSGSILTTYQKKYCNVIVFDKKNEGCSVARNVGMKVARGDYLWFVDNDDIIADDAIQTLFKAVRKVRENIDCISFPYCSFTDVDVDSEGRVVYSKAFDKQGAMIGNALWPQIFRRDFIVHNGLVHRGKRKDKPFYGFGMDALFIFECKRHGMTSSFLDQNAPLYFYRRARNSITTDISLEAHKARVREYIELIPIIQQYYEEEKKLHGMATAETANILMDYIRTLLEFVVRTPKEEFRKAKYLVRQAGLFPFEQPDECEYTCSTFTKGKKGIQRLCGYFHYNIVKPWGMMGMTVLHRYQNVVISMKSTIRRMIRR